MTEHRIEKDALGEVRVPAHRLWGAQTQRSLENFPIGQPRFRWGREVIKAFGIIKQASARANAELGELARDKAELIIRAAQDVIDGKLRRVPVGRVPDRVGHAVEHECQRSDR